MENTNLIKDGAFKVVLPITGARRAWVTKTDGTVDDELFLRVEASGPERDSHADRMSEKALGKMVGYCERGYDGGPVPFLDGHHRDLLSAHLGDIFNPGLGENLHFGFDMKVKKRNPFAIELFEDVLAGKKHGASIAGIVHDAEIEEYEENEFGRLFHDVEIVEVSRTSWPSWRPSFITLLAKNIGKSPEGKEALLMRRNEIIGGLKAMKDNEPVEEVEPQTAWVQDESGEWVEKITAPHGWGKKFSVSNVPWSQVKNRGKPCQFAIIKKKQDGTFSKSKSGYPHHMPNCTAINRGGTIAAGGRLIQAMKSEWPEIEVPPLDVLMGEEYIEEVSRFSREELAYAARHILKHYRRDLKMDPPKNLVGITKEFDPENLEDVVEIIRNLVEVVTMSDKETPAEVVEETPQEEPVVEKVVELEGEPTVITDTTVKTEEPKAEEDTETVTEPVEETQPVEEVETPVEDVAGETVEEPEVQRNDSDSLADAVGKRLLAQQFSELHYAMNEKVREAVTRKDVQKAHQILDDFVVLGKDIITKVLASDMSMYWTDEATLRAFTDRVELAEGRLSVNRVVEMDAAIEALVANAVSLRDLMKKADVIDDTAVQRAAQESAQAVAQQISPEMQAMQERMQKVEEQNQEQLHEVARVLAEPQVAQPKGDGNPLVPQEQTPEQKRDSAWARFGKSVPIADHLMREMRK